MLEEWLENLETTRKNIESITENLNKLNEGLSVTQLVDLPVRRASFEKVTGWKWIISEAIEKADWITHELKSLREELIESANQSAMGRKTNSFEEVVEEYKEVYE